MKKFLAAFICIIILASSLCSCGLFDEKSNKIVSKSHPFFGDKTQICYASYTQIDGTFFGRVYLHNLGDLSKGLPIGFYEVIKINVNYGRVSDVEPIMLKIYTKETSKGFELAGFAYDYKDLNENPPEEMQKLIEDFIKKYEGS